MKAAVEKPQYSSSPRHMPQAAIDNTAKCMTSKCRICCKYGSDGKHKTCNPPTRNKTLQHDRNSVIQKYAERDNDKMMLSFSKLQDG